MDVRIDRPFFLYANCIVEYHGRAESITTPGMRVILHKLDGTLLVHKCSLVTPLNYNGPKSKLSIDGDTLVSVNQHGEIIKIHIIDIIHYHELIEWSSDSITVRGTENDVCNYIVDNISDLIQITPKMITRELKTPHGSLDIVVTDADQVRHCIEVKRNKATLRAVFQLDGYMQYMTQHFDCKGYLAAPDIGNNALDNLVSKGYRFISVKDYKHESQECPGCSVLQ